ncbi:hypothetical protein GYMLUDRAFT_250946 [Collybiopsis luxurians FD-317 M1]|uniref:NERD domain-containing protein n=1 Tax=Collybiopsis luxurians FD-317 M1 TaxID=944289 RepID=A0A0D0BT99_9AGAR|nr:hypothetical protein GYMLUDRAFT_250946 [Collybiopsis luxurians FD-317 M1]
MDLTSEPILSDLHGFTWDEVQVIAEHLQPRLTDGERLRLREQLESECPSHRLVNKTEGVSQLHYAPFGVFTIVGSFSFQTPTIFKFSKHNVPWLHQLLTAALLRLIERGFSLEKGVPVSMTDLVGTDDPAYSWVMSVLSLKQQFLQSIFYCAVNCETIRSSLKNYFQLLPLHAQMKYKEAIQHVLQQILSHYPTIVELKVQKHLSGADGYVDVFVITPEAYLIIELKSVPWDCLKNASGTRKIQHPSEIPSNDKSILSLLQYILSSRQ